MAFTIASTAFCELKLDVENVRIIGGMTAALGAALPLRLTDNGDGTGSLSMTATVDSEFPTAAALNGTWAKTTVAPISGAAVMLSDGTNLILAVSGAGAVSTAVQRVTLASNDPAVTALGLVATAAKQPALGIALTPSTDVITMQKPAVTQVVSTALEASHVLKASAGQLVQLTIFNSKASAQFVLLMNSTTVPGDGAVTLLYPPIPVAAASILVLDLPSPLVASTGIAVSNSSTGTFTKTIGSADCVFYAQVN